MKIYKSIVGGQYAIAKKTYLDGKSLYWVQERIKPMFYFNWIWQDFYPFYFGFDTFERAEKELNDYIEGEDKLHWSTTLVKTEIL